VRNVARLSVNINNETAEAIRRSQERNKTTATDVIRRAVSVYAFLHAAQENGQEIQTEDGRGRRTKVVIL
jgi:hypothetical protein